MKILVARKNPSFLRDTRFQENFFEPLIIFSQEDEDIISQTLKNLKDNYVLSITDVSSWYKIQNALHKKFEFSNVISFNDTLRIFRLSDIVPGSDKKTIDEIILLEDRNYRFPLVRDIFLKGIKVEDKYYYLEL